MLTFPLVDFARLEERISEISEAAYFAGWAFGIEFEIYDCLVTENRRVGQIALSAAQVQELADLASDGDWISHPIHGGGAQLVPAAIWRPAYARWKAGTGRDRLIPEIFRKLRTDEPTPSFCG